MPGRCLDDHASQSIWLAAGTRVATINGEMPIEEVQPGQRVLTRAAGLVRVRAVGAATVRTRGCLQALVVPAGALGHGLPELDLTVAGDQRVFVFGDLARDGEGFAAPAGLGVARQAPDCAMVRLELATKGPVAVLANGAWLGSGAPVATGHAQDRTAEAGLSA